MHNGFLPAALMAILPAFALTACTTTSQAPPATDDHADHATAVPVADSHAHHAAAIGPVTPDEKGRQLYGAAHEMNDEMLAEFRGKAIYAGFTDEQIVQSMSHMGPNYTWYASQPELRGQYGVLILAHGFGDHGDAVLKQQLQTTAQLNPTTFAYGMSMMTSDHIQLGMNDLTDAGVTDIVVIPVVSTRHNSLMRQWDYIFSRQDEAPYASVPRVSTPARLHFVTPLEDHPLVGEILVDYANEISQDPANEEVILVAHGPVDPEENRTQLAMMENLADFIRADSNFVAVHVVTLQDDAAREVRMARIRELRELVARANQQGRDVLIVSNLLGTRIVQSSLRRNLRGLNYRFNTKGLIQHENFIVWINASLAEKLAELGVN